MCAAPAEVAGVAPTDEHAMGDRPGGEGEQAVERVGFGAIEIVVRGMVYVRRTIGEGVILPEIVLQFLRGADKGVLKIRVRAEHLTDTELYEAILLIETRAFGGAGVVSRQKGTVVPSGRFGDAIDDGGVDDPVTVQIRRDDFEGVGGALTGNTRGIGRARMEQKGGILAETILGGQADEVGFASIDDAVAIGFCVGAEDPYTEGVIGDALVSIEFRAEQAVISGADGDAQAIRALRTFGDDVDQSTRVRLTVQRVGPLDDFDAVDELGWDEVAAGDPVDEHVSVAETTNGKNVPTIRDRLTAGLCDGGREGKGLSELIDRHVTEQL